MRNRVRLALNELGSDSQSDPEQGLWLNLEAKMDSARIGTIHSLCGEIIRAHPELVPVDPRFEVLDEAISATLQVRVIEDTLTWATQQPELKPIFDCFQIRTLENLISFALQRRLDLIEFLAEHPESSTGDDFIIAALVDFLLCDINTDLIYDLNRMHNEGELISDAGPTLALQIERLLIEWTSAKQKIAANDLNGTLNSLYDIRKQYMRLNAGKKDSRAKNFLKKLRISYDSSIGNWLTSAPDPNVQTAYSHVFPLFIQLLEKALIIYRSLLAERRALDFDDLEYFTVQLLKHPGVLNHWQHEIHALLVDEYQDTNQRQRNIIEALAGSQPGRLFIVGDDRQSIYRFRGADVTVFRETRESMEARAGEVILLEKTFRPHRSLIQGTGDLLKPVMASPNEPAPPYWVTFSSLKPHRTTPRSGSQAPYIELLIGIGENAASGRETAARLLSQHLYQMRKSGQIHRWHDVAMLFRATTNFPAYEDALDAAGIPYVTIAGRGFYERPEIRDLLNILKALSDPWDDLAIAGLMRSPAFGLTDASLYQLRWSNTKSGDDKPQHHRFALTSNLDQLEPDEKEKALRAGKFIDEFAQLVERLPVSELLKLILDYTDYRAIMATGNNRFWRNVDKLLADAHNSRIINIRAFLEYVENLRDVGAREGEAPPDVIPSSESEGTVQLMSVHKSKGLEFPIVVMADASYSRSNRAEVAYIHPEIGFGLKLDRFDQPPIQYSYFKQYDAQQEEAEDKRLIYVAATRASEKLIVNGHWSKRIGKCWLKELAQAAEIDLKSLIEEPNLKKTFILPYEEQISACAWESEAIELSTKRIGLARKDQNLDLHLGEGIAIYQPLISTNIRSINKFEDDTDEPQGTSTVRQPPDERIIGILVHKAIQRWIFPGDQDFYRVLEITAINHGLVDATRKANVLQTAGELLERLKKHDLWIEIESALEKHHEVPYIWSDNQYIDSGQVDLLYRTELGWKLVDFKVDTIIDFDHLNDAIKKHDHQMARYKSALQILLKGELQVQLCFLDCMGDVKLINL